MGFNITGRSYILRQGKQLLTGIIVGSSLVACAPNSQNQVLGKSSQNLKPLTADEVSADFDAMIGAIKSLYGPYEYKERRFQYKLIDEAAKIKAELATAKTDDEKMSKFYQMLRLLQDGHVSLQNPFGSEKRIPILAVPVGNSFYLDFVSPGLKEHNLSRGDELISIDGKKPADLLSTILKYEWWGNAVSDQQSAYRFFIRPAHIPEIFPADLFATIEVKKPDGTVALARIPWTKTGPFQKAQLRPQIDSTKTTGNRGLELTMFSDISGARNAAAYLATLDPVSGGVDRNISVKEMGATAPFFWSNMLRLKSQFTSVQAEPDRFKAAYMAWKAEDAPYSPGEAVKTPDKMPEIFAGLYRYSGKTILMMRQPSYMAEDDTANLAVYAALISQYQSIADVLVLDQTHNPGGSVSYVSNFTRLFAPKGLNTFVQFLNNDRRWMAGLINEAGTLASIPTLLTQAFAQTIRATIAGLERDQEAGLRLSKEPFAFGPTPIVKPAFVTWNKPMVVLIDELDASGGDAFPKLVKANKLGVLFGQRTAGMGGSVEPVLELPYSRASLRLTRGLFTAFDPSGNYTDADMVENNGVTPDVQYTHNVDDFRRGYLEYFKNFSDAAVMAKRP